MVVAAGVANADQFRRHMGTEEVHHFLLERLDSLPQAKAIGLIDDAGGIVNTSRAWPVQPVDVSKGEIFSYLRDHNDTGAFIGLPVVSKVTGAWEIVLSRRVNGPGGEFLGIVAGVVELKYLEDFYRAISTSSGESVSLFRRDGALLARYPRVENMIGHPISTQSRWYDVVARGGGTYRTSDDRDDIPRIVSVQPLREYPFAVTVTTSEAEALVPWRHQSMLIAIGAFGAIIGFFILFRALAAQFGRLAQSEARFCGYTLTSSDWFWETDEHHRFTFVSEGIRTFGQDPGSPIGRTRLELAGDAESNAPKWQEHLAVLNRHEPFRDFIYTTRLGPQITVSVSGDPYFDQAGRFWGYRGTARDITDLKVKETLLREAMDHLNRVQRIAGIGSLTVDLRTEPEHISWSASACELFGLDPASVESTPEFLLNLIHPDDRVKVKRASDRAYRTRTAAPPLEYRIVRPGGTERTIYRENAIQHDHSGEPVRRIVTYKDITEIKDTEAQLRQTQDDLNRAQRLAKVGSDVWNLRTGTVVWSEETYRIFGVDPSTFVPTTENFLNFVVPEDRPGLLARREELLRGKPPAATKINIRRPDGEVRQIYSEAELVLDKNGKPLRWVGMRQDITEQTRVERSLRDAKEAAEAANVAKSQFLANTSHELRTPLNAIIGFSDMLRLGLVGRLREKQKEYLTLIHQSGQHLLNVINDILDLAHVDSGKFELHEEAGVDVRHVIDSCVSLMRDRANAEGLRLSTEIEDHLPLLVADPTRPKQILLNLMSNAIKFTEPGGSVAVTAGHHTGGGVAFEVRDTGPGMTPDEIDIALEPFGQVDASHIRQHEGTGLGLPIARRLAELHGGSLHVSSEKRGGTTVYVTLPASRTAAATAAVADNAEHRVSAA